MPSSFFPRDSKVDAQQAIDHLMGRIQLDRPPLVEYIVDETVMRPVVPRSWDGPGRETCRAGWITSWPSFGHGLQPDQVRARPAV